MYTKEELESMDTLQLMGIAEQLGVKVSPDDELETVVYAILDKAAEESAMSSAAAPKRKRTRIVKKDTNKVYTVNGKELTNEGIQHVIGYLCEEVNVKVEDVLFKVKATGQNNGAVTLKLHNGAVSTF